ncbi:MAG TPA: hypothetical protein VEY12_07235 [Thermoplasmata archaeon]|nr:hypothetical protein [Thermoplasmata archaeon]
MRPLPPSGRGRHLVVAAAVLLAATLVLGALPAPAHAQPAPELGTGIFVVNGASNATFSLAGGGTYFLVVATDDASSFVDARVTYNGSPAAQTNGSGSAASMVSLAGGNYAITLTGHGRAALGWDFTSGSIQTFPDNATMSAFLRPASAHIDLTVSLESAQAIRLAVYDDRLLPVSQANVTTSSVVSVDLPASHATSAFLVASAVAGNGNGVFALAWSSPAPPAPGPGMASQILVVVAWIGVPVVVGLLGFLVLRRRR